ncbi:MAG: prolipoprotein diacylglyceryl transferase, partial [Victivallales bacterium]|nr:prolipoprotein diacylglyceryl transferase [Victivallales bacterium]
GILAFLLMKFRCKKTSIKEEALSDIAVIVLFSALIGARLFYVVRFWNENFAMRPFFDVFKVWEGGLVFQGGFIIATIVLIGYCLMKKMSIGELGDLIAPAIPLGHAIGRIGCFINGCCFGFVPYDGPLAVKYTFSPASHFPVQLVESFGNLLICGFLLFMEKKNYAQSKRFLVYLMLYTVLRFAVEPLRGDYPLDQVWMNMTPGQYHALWQLPLIIAVFFAVSFLKKKNNSQKALSPIRGGNCSCQDGSSKPPKGANISNPRLSEAKSGGRNPLQDNDREEVEPTLLENRVSQKNSKKA